MFKNKPLFYLHIHKCGGSSVRDIIRSNIPLGRLSPSDIYLRDENKKVPFDETTRVYFDEERSLQAKFSAAHINYYEVPNAGRWQWITVLRHPIDRVISDYYYKIWQARIGNPYFKGMKNLTWEEYLNHMGQGQANNHMCRMLVGPDWPRDTNSAKAVELLDHFAVVGILENSNYGNQFIINYVSDYLKLPRQLAPKTNINPLAQREVSPEIRARIANLNTADLRLYQAAKNRIVEQPSHSGRCIISKPGTPQH